jgi:hypothetical protein
MRVEVLAPCVQKQPKFQDLKPGDAFRYPAGTHAYLVVARDLASSSMDFCRGQAARGKKHGNCYAACLQTGIIYPADPCKVIVPLALKVVSDVPV